MITLYEPANGAPGKRYVWHYYPDDDKAVLMRDPFDYASVLVGSVLEGAVARQLLDYMEANDDLAEWLPDL